MASVENFNDLVNRIYADLQDGIIDENEARQRLAEAYVLTANQSQRLPQNTDDIVTQAEEAIGNILSGERLPDNLRPDVRSRSSDDLIYDARPEAAMELETRQRLAEQGIGEKIDDPEYWRRMLGQAAKGPAQVANAFGNAIPGLGAMGLDAMLGDGSIDPLSFLESAGQQQEHINQRFNVSDPLTASESFAEAGIGAVVPGGWFAKLLGVGGDFAIDQSIRELTMPADDYETIFDTMGVTDQTQQEPWIDPLTAIGAVAAISVGAGVSINTLRNWQSKRAALPPPIRPVKEVDPTGPDNLDTMDTTTDLLKTYLLDDTQALKDRARRAGVPDFDDIAMRLDTDVHSAARTRIQEGINTGHLATLNANFDVPVAPRDLYNAYNSLEPAMRKDVSAMIHLHDMMDDARIAIANQTPGNHGRTIAMAQREIAAIAQRTPIASQFQKDYVAITRGVRDFLEGGLFSPKFRQQLDKTRPNYVPLEMSDIDINAPLTQRLIQAQNDNTTVRDDWFLKTRDSTGNYDMSRRVDPFEVLMSYTEQSLGARMRNDTQLAYIDGLLGSQYGKTTIRKVEADEAEKVQGRLVTVFRNGEKETYVTTQLTADLLRFDPYIAKFPTMFGVKRISEKYMVGVFQPMFAFTSAMRDTIAAYTTRIPGTTVADPLQVTAAVPEVLFAQAKGAVARHMQSTLAGGGEGFLPHAMMARTDQKALADRVSQSYMDTLYHSMNTEGGFDASILTSRVRAGEQTMKELRRSVLEGTQNNPALNNMVTRFGRTGTVALFDGISAIFSAVRDSPRYATIKQTNEAGVPMREAVVLGKQITGDTSRSGKVYRADGQRIRHDGVDQGVTNLVTQRMGRVINLASEITPFFNPQVQGMRRLVNAFYENPFQAMGRAWLTVGLPTVAAYGWNEILGKEYNDYAMQRRSATDVAMKLYFGNPLATPEHGIEIELPHELLPFSSPLTTMMYGWGRGQGGDEMSASMQIITRTILGNTVELGFPTIAELGMNAYGVKAPDSILDGRGTYNLREDHLGFLPENVEAMVRTMFSSLGNLALTTAYGIAEGDAGLDEFMDNAGQTLLENTPVRRNITGAKRANIAFSVPQQYNRQRLQSFGQFQAYYSAYFNPKRLNDDGLQKPNSENYYVKRNFPGDESEDLPFLMIGPEQMREPSNPLYPMVGAYIMENINSGGMGMTAINSRLSNYNQYVQRLRRFNANDKVDLTQWQKDLMSLDNPAEDTEALQTLLQDHKIDLENYYDRVKLINLIEHKRSELIRMQLNVLDQVESDITAMLKEQGLLTSGQRFSLQEHLQPFDDNPFGGP